MPVDAEWVQAQGEDSVFFASAHQPFVQQNPDKIAVAVSGGGDSMALLHVSARLAKQTGQQLYAVTVDHGLRTQSAQEAQFVAAHCARLDVPHQTLNWHRTQTTGNLQDQARRARYQLMASWAADNDIEHISLAHTATDQAETFLLRLARASGVDGLSGMRDHWVDRGVQFNRPFLTHSRDALRSYLRRHDVSWIDDPSNDDPRFDRVKARRALDALAPLGITVSKLNTVSRNLRKERDLLVAATQTAAAAVVTIDRGDVLFDCDRLDALSLAMRRRLVLRALIWVSSADYAPRALSIAHVCDAISQGKPATLAGCQITYADAKVRFSREPKAANKAVCKTDEIWDGRWQLTGPHNVGLQVKALGATGIRECPNWRASGLPRASILSSPAVWDGDVLIAAPIAGLSNGWSAQIVADFHKTPFAH